MSEPDYTPDDEAESSLTSRAKVPDYPIAFSSLLADGYCAGRVDSDLPRPGFNAGTEGLSGHGPVHYHFVADALCVFDSVWDILLEIHPSGWVRTRCTFAIRVCRVASPTRTALSQRGNPQLILLLFSQRRPPLGHRISWPRSGLPPAI